MKLKLSSPLQKNINIAETSTGSSTDVSTCLSPKKRKLDYGKNVQTLSKAKTELTNVLTANVKEKIAYEIELLKATLEKEKTTVEKEKLKIELLKLLIAEKLQKRKQNESDIIITS